MSEETDRLNNLIEKDLESNGLFRRLLLDRLDVLSRIMLDIAVSQRKLAGRDEDELFEDVEWD
jgi:hypothetical protein